MSIDDLLRTIIEFADATGISKPRRLRVEFDDARDLIDVPILAGKAKRKVYTTEEPEEEKLTSDHPVDCAIVRIIMESKHRLTGTLVVDKLIAANRGKPGSRSRR